MLSDEIWSAWQSGQEVPGHAWRQFSAAACRTAVDVTRESCLAGLGKEQKAMSLQKASIDRRLDVLNDAIAVLQHGGHGWERKYREAMQSLQTLT